MREKWKFGAPELILGLIAGPGGDPEVQCYVRTVSVLRDLACKVPGFREVFASGWDAGHWIGQGPMRVWSRIVLRLGWAYEADGTFLDG